jgi:hypothetical protein
MKPFELDSHMLTLRGVFYPTGHVLAMLPGRQQAEQAAQAVMKEGIPGDEISLLSPDTILGPIARTVGSTDIPFPSPGTEGETVRNLARHASQGEWGVLVHAPKSAAYECVMKGLKGQPVTLAERYRQLVIEDLET